MDNTTIIAEMEGSVDYIESRLEIFKRQQDGDSDLNNEIAIGNVQIAIEQLRGEIGDLVP